MSSTAVRDFRYTQLFFYGDNSIKYDPTFTHEKFITWARELKNDEGFLIAILDSLSEQRQAAANTTANPLSRDPIRVARVYAKLKELDGHEFTLPEMSFFDDPRSPEGRDNFLASVFVIVCQIIYTVAIVYTICVSHITGEIVHARHSRTDLDAIDHVGTIIIYATTPLSLYFFYQIVGKQSFNARLFNKAIESLRVDKEEDDKYLSFRREVCLGLNYFSNTVLGWTLYGINTMFIFTAETASDAILNGIATAFIIEMDELTSPLMKRSKPRCDKKTKYDWKNKEIDGKIAAFAMDYITKNGTEKVRNRNQECDITITRSRADTTTNFWNENYRNTDFFLVYAEEEEEEKEGKDDEELHTNNNSNKTYTIRVFCAISDRSIKKKQKPKNQSSLDDTFKETQPGLYEEINYEISGPGARAFYNDHLRNFQCVEFCRVLPEKKNT